VNISTLRPIILKASLKACAHFRDVAERYQGLIQKRLGIELTGPDPEIRIATTEIGNDVMIVSLFCPVDEAIGIEQVITERFMVVWYQELKRQEGVL